MPTCQDAAPTADTHDDVDPVGVTSALRDRLAELAAVTEVIADLPAPAIDDHIEAVRALVHDDVLRRAHAEELTLLPPVEQLDRDGRQLSRRLLAEHATIRDAAAAVDDLAARGATSTSADRVAGVLDTTMWLLERHLAHDADADARLASDQHQGCALSSTDARVSPPLPETV